MKLTIQFWEIILPIIFIGYFLTRKNDLENKSDFQLYLVKNSEAKCLDGLPTSYYLKKGSGDGLKKYILYFEGGGWIGGKDYNETLSNAYLRTKSNMGTTYGLPKTRHFSRGMFTSDQKQNPNFYDWNIVYINYCDGTGHQGYKKDPIRYKDKDIYFRGENNTIQTIQQLRDDHQLHDAEIIILSGCSSGGQAVFYWANYLDELFPNKIRAVPDSGLFLDMSPINKDEKLTYRNYYYKQFINIVNVETDPPNKECVKDNMDEKWKCLMSPYLVNYIKPKLFYVQSNYDQWAIINILKMNCIIDGTLSQCSDEERQYIEEHHKNTYKIINDSLEKNKEWGAWVPSCINHCHEEWDAFNHLDYTVPQKSEYTLSNSLFLWLLYPENLNTDNKHIDMVNWPHNLACSRYYKNIEK